nr:hypothetical protein [Brevundimonas subvibrioides]
MSREGLPRTYFDDNAAWTLAQLETWAGQVEGITQSRISAIKIKDGKTTVTVDLRTKKPATQPGIRMGHIPLAAGSIMGQALIMNQPADVTVYRK